MTRTNIALVAVLIAGLAILGLQGRFGGGEETTRTAGRLFADFNKEAVDRIVVEGGWAETKFVFERIGSEWRFVSGGGYPAKAGTADKLVDAVYHLRKDAELGSSAKLQKDTRVDDRGRIVRLFAGDKEMAAFRVGKNPPGSYQDFFIRKEGEETVWRTRTLLTSEREKEIDPAAPIWMSGRSGFSWDTYIQNTREWLDGEIWNLGDIEVEEIKFTRPEFEVHLVRKGEDQWEIAGDEPVAADADAVDSMINRVKYLTLFDVVGRHADVAAQYGLDKPAITFAMTAKKKVEKVEKTDGPETPDEGEEKEGDEKDEKEEKSDEFVTVIYILKVGKKLELPNGYDDDEGKIERKEYYPITIQATPRDEANGWKDDYVFLVRDYSMADLDKTLDDLKLAEPEKEDKPGDGEDDTEDDAADPPKDEEKGDKEDEPKGDEPKGDEPKSDEPKGDEPKSDEPKGDEPKGDEPKSDEPKGDEPKSDEPK